MSYRPGLPAAPPAGRHRRRWAPCFALPCRVRATEKYGHIVLLRLKDTQSVLPVYIGEFECGALVKEINKKPTVRRQGWGPGGAAWDSAAGNAAPAWPRIMPQFRPTVC